jgi:hypothetical protein
MIEELEKFSERRDKAVEGLSRCDVLLGENEILKLGYEVVDFAGAVSDRDEHEFIVYSKGKKRIVFVQTYTEREGGLYFQSLFADKETADELERPLVEASVNNPSDGLRETVLHFRGVTNPATGQVYSDHSIYMGCHHFLTIANDPELAGRVMDYFLKQD